MADMNETPNDLLNLALARAGRDRHFVASAINAWSGANPGRSVSEYLGCSGDDVRRLALAPRPTSDKAFPATVQAICRDFPVNRDALVALFRAADTLDALRGGDPVGGLLLAARDRDPEGGGN